jgi:acyl carrier protein
MPFKAVASIDSFMLIELISAIEDHFGVTISNTDLGDFKTIDDIVAYVESKNMA